MVMKNLDLDEIKALAANQQLEHLKLHRQSNKDTVAIGPKTLTKVDLVETLSNQLGLNKREAKDMVDAFFSEISEALESGENVKLSGFGHFQIRKKALRPGRNPKTGETFPVDARSVVTFHVSQRLKKIIEDKAIDVENHNQFNDSYSIDDESM